jgi:glutamate carboxypeptidase
VEAHSGSAPEKGRNAGYEMAHQILGMRDLSDKEKGTDVNWTMGSFGTKSNVIPGVAHAHANARITYISEWDRIERDIRERIKSKLFPESEIRFEITRGRPPFEPNEATDALAAKIIAISRKELAWPLKGVQSGGANDSSYSSRTAPVAIDGFSLGGAYAHSLEEHYNLDHFVPRMYLWLRTAQETMKGAMVPLLKKS